MGIIHARDGVQAGDGDRGVTVGEYGDDGHRGVTGLLHGVMVIAAAAAVAAPTTMGMRS